MPNYIFINGSIKCMGHQTRFEPHFLFSTWSDFENSYPFNTFFCHEFGTTNFSDLQAETHCWHVTKQAFLCEKSGQCISKHRLVDGIDDCRYAEDEDNPHECYMKKQYRLNCSGNSSPCLFVSAIGDDVTQCVSGNDEYMRELKWNLADRKCRKPNSLECNILKSYIRSPSSISTIENNKVLLFRQYCDTLWQLPKGFDESLCNDWKCPKDQYQCLSGHCISVNYILNPSGLEWNCPDASDNIGIFRIRELSEHNIQPMNQLDLAYIKTYLTGLINHGKYVPFIRFCNHIKEYGCILDNVDDPLNFTINRPCINLTQIGDGKIDCYGGLDERNLLTCGDNLYEQRGYDFHCSNQECISYDRQCEKRCSNKADSLLCDQLQILWKLSCENHTREEICNSHFDDQCDLFGVRRYYCDIDRRGK
jgi:hypothetical protein